MPTRTARPSTPVARTQGWLMLLCVVCLIISGCSRDNLGVAGVSRLGPREAGPVPPPLSPQQYVGELDAILRCINSCYCHKDRKQIDVEALRADFEPRAQAAENITEFNFILIELFSRLQNGHAEVYTWTKQYEAPVQCTLLDDRLVITSAADDLPELVGTGIGKGWTIQQINHLPAADWLRAQFKRISASTEQSLWQRSTDCVFRRYEGEPELRHYVFANPQGQTVAVELSLRTPMPLGRVSTLAPIESTDLGTIGYIAINSTESTVNEFDQALRSLESKQGLILDLRANPGGNPYTAASLLQRLIQEDTKTHLGMLKPDAKVNYAGPLVVLVGPGTFSAAEGFAFDLADSGRALFIGEPTGGDSGEGTTGYITDGGVRFRFPAEQLEYSASGLPMEGFGLQPDLLIRQSYTDFLNGKDTALEIAKTKLQELIDNRQP